MLTQYVQSGLVIAGAVYTICSTLATLLKQGTAVQRFFATVALDIRKILPGAGGQS